MDESLPFTHLSHYRVLRRLGAGGMGEVYLAEDPRLERRVAIKVLPAEFTVDSERVRRFLLEAKASSALNHPHIITVHDVGESPAGQFIVMEAVEGRTVRSLLVDGLPLSELVRLGGQMAKGLAAAHAAGIVHRDIKPENIMVRSDGYVKILDFGLARLTGPDSQAPREGGTEPGMFMGTLKYMSPEQALGEVATAASDVYALGMVFFEMATGRYPYTAQSFLGIMNAIVAAPPGRAALLNPELSPELDELIARMLYKDPAGRPTASEVAEALAPASVTGSFVSAMMPVAVAAPATPPRHTVGRTREMADLRAAVSAVSAGRGALWCVTGEPGIGKSTLVEEFLTRIAAEGVCTIARGRCSERLAGTEAYLPVLGALDHLLQSSASWSRTLKEQAPAWFGQIAMGSTADGALAVSQDRLKRELYLFFAEVARVRPVLLFLDDLHWADVSTVDVLSYLASHFNEIRMLVVVTYRPSDMLLAAHPFLALKPDLAGRGLLRELPLSFLSEAEISQYLSLEFPGHRFPSGFARLIQSKTEGSPLFMADLVRYLRDGAVISSDSGAWQLARALPEIEKELPESVRGMIERKIGQLSSDDLQLLRVASVQGFEFDSAVLGRVLGLDAEVVEERLEALERVYSFVKLVREAEFPSRVLTLRYRFVHVLYQNILFSEIRATRRATLSRDVALVLESYWGTKAGQAANELALLWEAAREYGKAATYFALAARQAGKVFADAEAAELARRGLAALANVEETAERRDQELALLVTLGVALRAVKGFSAPEVGEAFGRARDLCPVGLVSPRMVPILRGLWEFYEVQANYAVALPYARQLLEVVTAIGDPGLVVVGCDVMGDTSVWMGDFSIAWEHLSRGIALYDGAAHRSHLFVYGYDTGMACYSYGAMALFHLGYAADAAAHMRRSSAIASELQHPMTTAFVGIMEAWLYRLMGDFNAAVKGAQLAISTSTEHGLPFFLGFGRMTLGWSWVGMGHAEEGVAEILAGMEVYRETGSQLGNSLWLGCLAEGYLASGRRDDARAAWAEAVTFMNRTGEGVYRLGLQRLETQLAN